MFYENIYWFRQQSGNFEVSPCQFKHVDSLVLTIFTVSRQFWINLYESQAWKLKTFRGTFISEKTP